MRRPNFKIKRMRLLGAIAAPAFFTLFLIAMTRPVHAWWAGGHRLCTLAAVKGLPQDMPAFFRDAGADLAEMSVEPDNWKNPSASHLRTTEQPEHFIDLEFLEGKPLPEQRFELTKFYIHAGIDPSRGGFLPYAMQEGYERLMLAFRDYRNQPASHSVQQRIVVYAGWLAHYCEDAGMPLHTSKYFDGRPGPGGEIFQKGIHAKIDSFPEKNGFTIESISEGLVPEPALNVWPLIVRAIEESHKQCDRCYELDANDAFDKDPAKGRAFILERTRASSKLVLDLWYSAWKNSDPEKATIK